MPEPEDFVDIEGLRTQRPKRTHDERPLKFLSIWFRCCNTYGRLNRNADATAYEGRCPRCGAPVQALIGPYGTSQRTFEAR